MPPRIALAILAKQSVCFAFLQAQKWGKIMADRRRRRKAQAEDAERALRYMQALQGKKIPLLTLDAKWHALFPDFRKTREIKRLEKELNRLIEKQGQTANDLLDYKKAKKVLMQNVIDNMTDGHEFDSPIRVRKQEKNT
jgi:hypothetical protein